MTNGIAALASASAETVACASSRPAGIATACRVDKLYTNKVRASPAGRCEMGRSVIRIILGLVAASLTGALGVFLRPTMGCAEDAIDLPEHAFIEY